MSIQHRGARTYFGVVFLKKKNTPSPPLRMVSEIAEHLGVTKRELSHALTKEQGAPACVLDHRHVSGPNRDRWYVQRDVVAWWKKRSEVKA